MIDVITCKLRERKRGFVNDYVYARANQTYT